MKKFYLFLGLALVYSFLVVAMNDKISKEKIAGKWNVKVADAPYGYQDYVIDIREISGTYKADILFVDSKNKINGQTLTSKDRKLTGSITVDNEEVEFAIWEKRAK